MAQRVGKVTRVGFAALKGTRHAALPSLILDEHGPVGDRDWCLVDTERRRVLRTVAHPLMGVEVAAYDERMRVTLPGGAVVEGPVEPASEPVGVDHWGRTVSVTPYDGAPARAIAGLVPELVELARAERGGVVYGAPVSLVGTASLADLAERMGRDEPLRQPERFRSTLVVETNEPWVEDTWAGREVTVGAAVIRVNARIGRCGVPNLHPGTSAADAPILKALAGFRPTNAAGEPCLGVDAFVVRPGAVRPGDPVLLR